MKILCPNCFKQITEFKYGKAKCHTCNTMFDLDAKASIFRVRLDGGYIKEGMSYNDVVNNIKKGNILADEYIATPNGPWITIYDSPFVSYIPKKRNKTLKKARTAVTLYKKQNISRGTIVFLTLLLAVSLTAIFFLLTIIQRMESRLETLVNKIIGG